MDHHDPARGPRMHMASSPHNLDYAPADPLKKPVRRKLILLAVLIAALYVGINHGMPIASGIRKTWVQGRCATFEYSDDTVIYETDPARGRSLIRAEPDEYVRINDTAVWPTPAVIRREPN